MPSGPAHESLEHAIGAAWHCQQGRIGSVLRGMCCQDAITSFCVGCASTREIAHQCCVTVSARKYRIGAAWAVLPE